MMMLRGCTGIFTAVDLNLLQALPILVTARMSANMRGCTFWRNLKYDFKECA